MKMKKTHWFTLTKVGQTLAMFGGVRIVRNHQGHYNLVGGECDRKGRTTKKSAPSGANHWGLRFERLSKAQLTDNRTVAQHGPDSRCFLIFML